MLPIAIHAEAFKGKDQLIEDIRSGARKPSDLSPDFVKQTYDRLTKAAELGYGKGYYSDALGNKMRENMLHFAATKTFVQQQKVAEMSGAFKKDEEYKKEAKNYLEIHNDTYLNVQAAWASRKGQSARQYQEWQRDKDIYPNVKFRTMKDERVRIAHQQLEGMVIPVDSPLMGMYMPPLGPRCRCWFEQTMEKTSSSMPQFTPDPEWSGNTGETGIIFNAENSYQKQVSELDTQDIRRQAEALKTNIPYRHEIKAGDNKVRVSDFADRSDYARNLPAAELLAKELKTDIYIRPHVNIDGVKNPEMAIGKPDELADLKTYTPGRGTFIGFVKNSLTSASKQRVATAIIDVTSYTETDKKKTLVRKLKGELAGKEKPGITGVIIIDAGQAISISRKEIQEGDFVKLDRLAQ